MIFIGGLTGVLSGLLGVGGGLIVVPLLVGAGFLMREAAAMSLLFVAFTAASGAYRHFKFGTVDPILTVILLSGATPMVLVGTHYSTILPHHTLQVAFALLVMAAGAAYLRWGRGNSVATGSVSQSHTIPSQRYVLDRRVRIGYEEISFSISVFYTLAIGAVFGFVSGLLGIGGGWLLIPLLVILTRIPLRVVVGTSLLSIILPAIMGAASHWYFGNLDLRASAPLIISGIIGAQLGAGMLAIISPGWLERLLIVLFLVISAYMLGHGIGWI